MKSLDVKEFFQQIRHIDSQINGKMEQLDRMKALATRVTVAMSEAGARTSGPSRGMENTIDKIIALQKELNADINRYVDLKRAANSIIGRIGNEKYRRVLESRYLLGKTWETIAAEMGMSCQGVLKLHGRALQEAEKFSPFF